MIPLAMPTPNSLRINDAQCSPFFHHRDQCTIVHASRPARRRDVGSTLRSRQGGFERPLGGGRRANRFNTRIRASSQQPPHDEDDSSKSNTGTDSHATPPDPLKADAPESLTKGSDRTEKLVSLLEMVDSAGKKKTFAEELIGSRLPPKELFYETVSLLVK
eukprot:862579-Prorocentrum_minimum.AAC.5